MWRHTPAEPGPASGGDTCEQPGPLLTIGQLRSYGDVCLNDDNYIIDFRWLDRLVRFDKVNGTISCEASICTCDGSRGSFDVQCWDTQEYSHVGTCWC